DGNGEQYVRCCLYRVAQRGQGSRALARRRRPGQGQITEVVQVDPLRSDTAFAQGIQSEAREDARAGVLAQTRRQDQNARRCIRHSFSVDVAASVGWCGPTLLPYTAV